MRNPFVYGEPVFGGNFCNRKEEIRKLKNDILSCQKIFLISSRRMGKTSLIKTAIDQISAKEIISISMDLEEFSSYREFLNTYLSLLVKKSTPENKILGFLRQVLSGLRINFKIDEIGKPVISLDYNQPINAELDSKIFNLPEIIASKQNKKLVIVFDEFQEILKLNRKNIEGKLRAHIQHHRNVAYVFAGSKRHLLNEMINSQDKPFYRIGPVMYLEKINEDIFLKFAKDKLKASGIKISDEALQKVIKLAENIPYYTQLLLHELWDSKIDKGLISENDVQLVLSQVIHLYSQNFHLEWSRMILSKRQLLKAISLYGGKQILSGDYLKKNNLGLPSAVRRTLLSLVEDGYLDKENGKYFFADILFREWIKLGVK
ncbi:ATP-binding protein [bacterium]|nr:ATP-binding protein [bacterium]